MDDPRYSEFENHISFFPIDFRLEMLYGDRWIHWTINGKEYHLLLDSEKLRKKLLENPVVVAYARKKHHSEPLPVEDERLISLWEKLKLDLDSIYTVVIIREGRL